ncbi:hypothetical protein D3C85_797580 [compost metagenome]
MNEEELERRAQLEPPDATHYRPKTCSWVLVEGEAWYYRLAVYGREWTLGSGPPPSDLVPLHKDWDHAIPPVGLKCEALWPADSDPQWYPFELLYLSDFHAIAQVGDKEACYTPSQLKLQVRFRPLLAPEQRALQERDEAVDRMLKVAGITGSAFADDPEARVWAAALYDDGYRRKADE